MTLYGSKFTGSILAGGQNSRFPKLKGFIKINGETIIDKNLSLLTPLFDEVIISANQREIYDIYNVPVIPDSLPSRGPLTGIYSSLKVCKGDALFVIACDMPLINKDLIVILCDYYLSFRISVSALVPIFKDKIHPLIGIYSKAILNTLESAILNNKVMMLKFLQEISAKYIDVGSIIQEEGDLINPFSNINTLQDLKELKRLGVEVSEE